MKAAQFSQQVAVVTGAGLSPDARRADAAGVGAAISHVLARGGARVFVLDREYQSALATVAAIKKEGAEAEAIEANVAQDDECQRAIGQVVERCGRLDVLVNNAAKRSVGETDPFSLDAWDELMAVNVRGAMMMSRTSAPHMRPGGSIVNISSIGALRPRGIAYPVSKGALNTLTLALAVEFGERQIRVNAVCPGSIWGPMSIHFSQSLPGDPSIQQLRAHRAASTLLRTEGTAWDIANAVSFFASEDARWITGQILVVDGGASIAPTSSQVTAVP